MATYVKIINFSNFSWPNPNRLRFGPGIDVHVAWNVVTLFGGGKQTIMHRLERLDSNIRPIPTEVERMQRGYFKINPANVEEVNLRCERQVGGMDEGGSYPTDQVPLKLRLGEPVTLQPFPGGNLGHVMVQMMLENDAGGWLGDRFGMDYRADKNAFLELIGYVNAMAENQLLLIANRSLELSVSARQIIIEAKVTGPYEGGLNDFHGFYIVNQSKDWGRLVVDPATTVANMMTGDPATTRVKIDGPEMYINIGGLAMKSGDKIILNAI